MKASRYCTVAILVPMAALSFVRAAAAQASQTAAAAPATGEATFVVFMNGREVGREQVSLARGATGWIITSTGRLAAPLNMTISHFELTYAPDWQPIQLKIDAVVQDRKLGLNTSFGTTTAINEVTQNGVTNSKTDQISARTVVLPNNFYAAYEGLAARLATAAAGTELPVYVAPQAEIRLAVKAISPSTYQTPAGTITTRRYTVTFQNPGGPLDADVTVDDRNRFARVDIAGGAVSVVRQDLAGVATRQQTVRNPTDIDVHIPASGFGLAGTLTTPQAQGRLKSPAVLFLAGSRSAERDGTIAGIPLFAQLAAQLADLGFVVLRYDKRGAGQSGGRTETVTLQDYAEDAIAAVRWLAKRKDVNDRRLLVVGHGEGAAVAMLAAAREKRISALVLIGGMGTTGRELILEQQQSLLDAAKTSEPDRTAKVELQKRILEAAVAEKGWDALPPDVRRAVDTPLYRSLLTFDPAKVMPQIKQPILVLQGALDAEVPAHHAERLAELAKARKNAPPVELKQLPSLNHLMVVAKTGDVAEYATLDPKAISPEIAKTIAPWFTTVAR